MPNDALRAAIETAPWAVPFAASFDTDDNALRADRAAQAVLAYAKSCQYSPDDDPIEQNIIDFVNDVWHLAARLGMDPYAVAGSTLRMFETETLESRSDPLRSAGES